MILHKKKLTIIKIQHSYIRLNRKHVLKLYEKSKITENNDLQGKQKTDSSFLKFNAKSKAQTDERNDLEHAFPYVKMVD